MNTRETKILMVKTLRKIKVYKLGQFPLLSIKYDGLHDVYFLFDKFVILKRENDRDFWNDWE